MLRPLSLSLERSLAARSPETAVGGLRRTLAGLQEQMATGRRVNRPSDDPIAFEKARSWEAHGARLESHQRAVGTARVWVDHTASALDDLSEFAVTAYESGIRGLNAALSDSDREALATKIDALTAQSIDRLNSRVGEEYLFAGNRTQEAPFAPDGSPSGGDVSGLRVRRIGPDVTLAINVPGDRVNDLGGGQTAIGALQSLAAALRGTGDPQAALAAVQDARDHFVALGAEVGEVGVRLTDADLQLEDAAVLASQRRSDLEDADLYQVAVDLQRTQGHFEAALQTLAAAKQRTLLDYLR